MANSRLKILFAINCLNIGGAPSVVINQLRSLDKAKFDPFVLTLYPSKQANYLAELNQILPPEKQFHCRLKNRSIFDLKTIWHIFQFLRQERFDLVYTHLFLTNLIVRSLGLVARVPVLVSFEHGTYSNKNFWQICFDRFLAKFTDLVIVPTNAVAEFTKKQQKLPDSKVMIVSNPFSVPKREEVDLASLRQEFGLSPSKLLFLMIGRFSEEKGHHVLLQAMQNMSEPNLQVVIIGHGPLEKKIRSTIEEKSLEDLVKIFIVPDRAKEFLYLADALILPSLREGQGLVAYEAILAGTPVISSDLPALRELIKEGENGLFFTVADPDSLRDQIIKFAHDSALREKLKLGAQKTAPNLETSGSIKKLEQKFYDLRRIA